MQKEEPKRQICFDFTKNQCSRGANCKFSHDLNLIIEVNSQEKGICFDFLKGTCSRGPLCRFSHDLRNLQAAKPTVTNPPLGPYRNGVPQNDLVSALHRPKIFPICYDFVKNQCSRGPECKYSHDFSSILMEPRQPAGKNPYVMCMDFVRGRCTRGPSCKYAHCDALQLAAAAAAAGGGSYGEIGGGGVTTMVAAAQEQAAMSHARINSNNCALAGLSSQDAQGLLAAARVAGRLHAHQHHHHQQQQQQQYFEGYDGFTFGIDPAWATQHIEQQQNIENEYSLSLLQLQQLAVHNDICLGEGAVARSTYNTSNSNIDNITSTAEDVLPIPLKVPLPSGQSSSLPRYQQQGYQQQQQQQSPNDVSALNMLFMQQQRQQQQQHDQFIRAHREQQQQQRRPSNLGLSSFPSSDTLHSVERSSNASAQATAEGVPFPTIHHQQQHHQHQNWAVNFHHPLHQKTNQSADLSHSGSLTTNNTSGTDKYPTTTTGSIINNPSVRDTSTLLNTTTNLGSGHGVGAPVTSSGGGGGGGARETNSPTIRASWGTTPTLGPQNINNNNTTHTSIHTNKDRASIIVSGQTSHPSILGAGSRLNDEHTTLGYMQQQQQQQQHHNQQQPELDALKSIWSKPS